MFAYARPHSARGMSLISVLVLMAFACSSVVALQTSYIGLLKQYQRDKHYASASRIAYATYTALQSQQGTPNAFKQTWHKQQQNIDCVFSIYVTRIGDAPTRVNIDISWEYLKQKHRYQIQGVLGPGVGYQSFV